MVSIALVVPVYKNFAGFAELIASIDHPVRPIIGKNWEENLGVSRSWNYGIELAGIEGLDYALVCNDDIFFDAGTIIKLVEAMEGSEFDMVTGLNRRDRTATEVPDYPEAPDFSCFMVRPDFLDKYGLFDEEFFPAYFEDNDMHYRMKLAGGKAVCRTDATFYHYGSVTQNWEGKPAVTSQMFEKNRAYYVRKWGGSPGKERFTQPFNGGNK